MEAATATSTPQEPTEPATEAHSASQADQGMGEPAGAEHGEDGRFLSREQANYRKRLHEATDQLGQVSAERDRLRAQVDALQREQVERIAGGVGMAVPGDLWVVGTDLAQLRDDAGHIDPEAVQVHVRDVLNARPTWRSITQTRSGIGEGAGAVDTRPAKVGLSQLLKP